MIRCGLENLAGLLGCERRMVLEQAARVCERDFDRSDRVRRHVAPHVTKLPRSRWARSAAIAPAGAQWNSLGAVNPGDDAFVVQAQHAWHVLTPLPQRAAPAP